MRIMGVNEFAARLPNAITGILVLIALYCLGTRLRDRQFGMLWALAYAGSFLPLLYLQSGIIDPVFNVLMFGAICGLCAGQQRSTQHNVAGTLVAFAAAGIAVGLAVLTKGPVALLLVGLTGSLFYLVRRKRYPIPVFALMLFSACAAVAAPWYIASALSDGGTNFSAFIARQIELLSTGVAGHTGPWYYHIVVLALGCFPASVFAAAGFRSAPTDSTFFDDFRLWMLLLMGVVLVVFSIVQTKIVHYSSLAYFPITFFAANGLYQMRGKYSRSTLWALGGAGILWAALLMAVPIVGLNARAIASRVSDPDVHAALLLPVEWSVAQVLIGVGYALSVVFAIFLAIRARRVSQREHSAFATGLAADIHMHIHTYAPAVLIFGGTLVATSVTAAVLIPRVEQYTQGAPIAFYETLRGRDVYVATLGFKSYAQLFYTAKTAEAARRETCGAAFMNAAARDTSTRAFTVEDWLLRGAIDRDAFFVAKADKAMRWRGIPDLHEMNSVGGYVFFERRAVTPSTATGCDK